MRSLPKILKASAVTVDSDNKFSIDASPVVPWVPEAEKPLEMEEESPEEIARNILQKAEQEAKKIQEKAQNEANRIIADAKKQATHESQSIRESSREEGYQEGYQKAEAEGKSIIKQAETVLNDARNQRKAMETSLEPDMVNLIEKIVAKLLGDTVQINPQVIINLIRQGFSGSNITGNVFVHVSQYEYEQVTENKDKLLALTDGSVRLEIVRDLSLDRMDCVIETSYGNIDCSLNQQFDALRANLTYILKSK